MEELQFNFHEALAVQNNGENYKADRLPVSKKDKGNNKQHSGIDSQMLHESKNICEWMSTRTRDKNHTRHVKTTLTKQNHGEKPLAA